MNSQYETFISFKSSDVNNRRTRDGELAREIHDYFVAQGVATFCSDCCLQDRGVSDYKRYIDKALDLVDILVVVGTSSDNLNTEWVRYEWDSFFNDILSGLKPRGRVFTYLDGVSIKSLPRSLRFTQSIAHGPKSLEQLYAFVDHALHEEKEPQVGFHAIHGISHEFINRGAKFTLSPSIEVVQGSILDCSSDFMVCPVDSTLLMSDGLQASIRRRVGNQLQFQALKHFLRLPLGEVKVIRGNDNWRYVAIANTVGWPLVRWFSSKDGAVRRIVREIAAKADALGVHSVHLPLLGAGAGWLDAQDSLNEIRRGLEDHFVQSEKSKILLTVFVLEPERFVSLKAMMQSQT